MAIKNVYWDANVFHALLGKEAGRVDICEEWEALAKAGGVKIWTSTLTWVEVVRMKGKDRIDPANEATLKGYFQRSYFQPIIATREVVEYARVLLWKYSALPYKDAVHLASAVIAKVEILHTYDGDDLIPLTGLVGTPPLLIEEPKTLRPEATPQDFPDFLKG